MAFDNGLAVGVALVYTHQHHDVFLQVRIVNVNISALVFITLALFLRIPLAFWIMM